MSLLGYWTQEDEHHIDFFGSFWINNPLWTNFELDDRQNDLILRRIYIDVLNSAYHIVILQIPTNSVAVEQISQHSQLHKFPKMFPCLEFSQYAKWRNESKSASKGNIFLDRSLLAVSHFSRNFSFRRVLSSFLLCKEYLFELNKYVNEIKQFFIKNMNWEIKN